jgi:hypothetical protein
MPTRIPARPDLRWSDVTLRADFLNRRQIILAAGGLLASPAVGAGFSTDAPPTP